MEINGIEYSELDLENLKNAGISASQAGEYLNDFIAVNVATMGYSISKCVAAITNIANIEKENPSKEYEILKLIAKD